MVEGGWHPDPQMPGQARWWDGQQWTEHVRPADEQAASVQALVAQAEAAKQAKAKARSDAKAAKASAAAARDAPTTDLLAPVVVGRGPVVKFEGVELRDGMIFGPGGSGPIVGAVATLDTAGQIEARFTATRLALMGPFALAFKKKKDKRELFLVIEGQGFSIVQEVPRKREQQARVFVARINGLGRTIVPAAPPAPPAPAAAAGTSKSIGEQLRELAELRDSGILTDDEFQAQKVRLLS